MQYFIVKSGDTQKVVTRVNDYIKEGWKPQGGISISMTRSTIGNYMSYEYAQAIVRE